MTALSETQKLEVLVGLVKERLENAIENLRNGSVPEEALAGEILKEIHLWHTQILHVQESLEALSEAQETEAGPLRQFLADLDFDPAARLEHIADMIRTWKDSNNFVQGLLSQAGIRAEGHEDFDAESALRRLNDTFTMVDQAAQFLRIVKEHIFDEQDQGPVGTNELTQWVLDSHAREKDSQTLKDIAALIFLPQETVAAGEWRSTIIGRVKDLHGFVSAVESSLIEFLPEGPERLSQALRLMNELGELFRLKFPLVMIDTPEGKRWDYETHGSPLAFLHSFLPHAELERPQGAPRCWGKGPDANDTACQECGFRASCQLKFERATRDEEGTRQAGRGPLPGDGGHDRPRPLQGVEEPGSED